MSLDFEGESFYQFAMALFMEAGHVFTSTPEYYNHSPERFAYFDNKPDASLSPTDRALLKRFNNVSRLFTVNGCAFFSISLFTRRPERSELAHNIHTMLHSIIDADGTIFLFRFEDEVMLSFMGFGYRCILSDWYSMFDPYDMLLHRLDIINMGINSGREYFDDLVYNLARDYYIVGTNHKLYKNHKTKSVLYWFDSEVKVTPRNGDDETPPIVVRIPAGTILINENAVHRDHARLNVYHECFHDE